MTKEQEEIIREWPLKKLCSHHKRRQLSYNPWHEWAEKQHKKGIRQELCPDCKHWLFPSEMKTKK